MKKTVSQLLDGCEPHQIDPLISDIDAELPEGADIDNIRSLTISKVRISNSRRIRRIIAIAVCAVMLAGVLVGCYVAEKVDYENAVEFFDLNDMTTDGLSRSDIKRVYRDISSESFEYDDSYKLLSESRDTYSVEGVDIKISNSMNNNTAVPDNLNYGYSLNEAHGDIPDGVSYTGDYYDGADADAFLTKSADGEVKWTTHFKTMTYSDDYYVAGGRVLITGYVMYDKLHDYMHTCLALVDDSTGELLWEKELDSKYHFDEYANAVLTADGCAAVLTIASDDRFSGENHLVFREFDITGKAVHEHEQRKDDMYYSFNLTEISDGWLAVYNAVTESSSVSSTLSTVPHILVFDSEGVIRREWDFADLGSDGSADGSCNIKSITEHDGRIFVAVTKRNSTDLYNGMDIEKMLPEGETFASFSDKARDRVRECFSAVLYVFDSASTKPQQFYSVGGAMALNESLSFGEDGSLVWRVGRIVRAGWSPYTSSFSLYGVTRRYDYTFDSDNKLLRQDRTDKFGSFTTL